MKILSIAWKDTLLRFSDRNEIIFFLILPLLFTFLLGGGGANPGDTTMPLLIVDLDGSAFASELVTLLRANDNVDVQMVAAGVAEERFAKNQADAWLSIPSGFEAALLEGDDAQIEWHKRANSSQADALERAVYSAISTVNRSLAAAQISLTEAERIQSFESDAERQVYLDESLAAARSAFAQAPERLQVTRPAAMAGQSYDPAAQASTGQMISWVFIPLLGTSALFAMERRLKTLPRLLTTPTRKGTYLFGTVVSQLAVAMVQMVLLIGFGVLVMGVSWGRSPGGLAVMMVAFGLAAVAFGVMLGAFVKTEKQGNNLSIMLGMVLSLLGGCWWPAELFPPAVQTAGLALPTTWAMRGFSDLVLGGAGMMDVLPYAGVLLGFAVVFFAIGVRRFSYE